ncbi:MAG: penicillin-binding protein 1C, partial [Chromatiaceae bacterium]
MRPLLLLPRRRWTLLAAGLVALALLSLAGVRWLALQVNRTEPPLLQRPTSPLVLDRADRLLRAFTVEDGRWRLAVTPAAVDPLLIEMLLAFEDRRFYRHRGVDSLALLRAARQALVQRRIVSGGSTLTMQVARLASGMPTRSAAGKWQQLLMAVALERVADKQAILTAWLNLAPYGGNLEGVRAAALAWLGKEPARLTPAEAALLVALPQAPAPRRPDRDPAAA